LVEINSVFAAYGVAAVRGWQADKPNRANVDGSAVSLGYLTEAAGALNRMTLPLQRPRQADRRFIESLCRGSHTVAFLFECA